MLSRNIKLNTWRRKEGTEINLHASFTTVLGRTKKSDSNSGCFAHAQRTSDTHRIAGHLKYLEVGAKRTVPTLQGTQHSASLFPHLSIQANINVYITEDRLTPFTSLA